MASSFSSQIPSIIHLVSKIAPTSVLDIGKGFGKYGFLLHEYLGIDNTKKLDPTLSLNQQSRLRIDCVEVDPDLMLPHLNQLYNNIFFENVLKNYEKYQAYDLILMIDIIEHLEKDAAIKMLKHFLAKGSTVIVATPIDFFEQELYESVFEHHVSHWTVSDFTKIANVDYQNFDAGRVYCISNKGVDYRGFGNSFIKKLRRVARCFRNEF